VPKEQDFDRLVTTMKKAAAALRDAGIPFALGGGLAVWARGGPASEHDVDLLVEPEDAERALQALVEAGMRAERPEEDWLLKAYDGDVLVDVIYDPSGGPVDEDLLGRAEEIEVMALRVPVARLEDVMVTKLLSITEQEPDYEGVLEIARAVREQIDWEEVRRRTDRSPFARAFFTLIEELGIVEREGSAR
jgi:predicted nucleotidyltransferase